MIRKLIPSDLDAVMQIWFDGNCEAHSFIPRSYWEEQRPAVRTAIQQADVYCYVSDGNVLGFIGLTGNYIAGLFVSTHSRGHGIGRQLLTTAKKNRSALELDAYQKNQRAINFYLQNCFVITRQTNDEVRMTWSAKK